MVGTKEQALIYLARQDDRYKYEVKKYIDKRSNEANRYLWELLGKLQENLSIPKEDIYRDLIRNIGSYEIIPIRNEAVDKFRKAWSERRCGLGN